MPAIGTLTMILTNVGLSIFNSIQSLKNNDKIRQQQQAFGEAKIKRERDRMWDNMRASQKLSQEIEEQLHKQRLEELNTGFERTITRLFYTQNINTWPLNTLPIVLKSGIAVKEDNRIPVLCILAPSNDKGFNKIIYPQIDMGLASHFDNYYSVNSTHNVLYLSRGWKSGYAPSGTEIDQLKTNLDSIPVLLIYPFFSEKGISFIINIWGMKGQSNAEEMMLQPQAETFSYPYLKIPNDPDYDDYVLTTTEEFSVFLKAFIGYVADTYYWQLYGEAPLLPSIMQFSKYVGTDAYEHDYKQLLHESLSDESVMINDNRRLTNLFYGAAPCLDQEEKDNYIRQALSQHCFSETINPEIISEYYGYKDIPCLKVLKENVSDDLIQVALDKGIELIEKRGELSFYTFSNFPYQQFINVSIENYDISETIISFIDFINKNKENYSQIQVSLYIEEVRYKTFLFHLFDNTTKQIVGGDNGYDYHITCNSLMYSKQVKDIFKHNERASIICSFERIPALLSRIHSNNLIY